VFLFQVMIHTRINAMSSLGCVSFESDRSRSYILGISPPPAISTKHSSLFIYHWLPTFFLTVGHIFLEVLHRHMTVSFTILLVVSRSNMNRRVNVISRFSLPNAVDTLLPSIISHVHETNDERLLLNIRWLKYSMKGYDKDYRKRRHTAKRYLHFALRSSNY